MPWRSSLIGKEQNKRRQLQTKVILSAANGEKDKKFVTIV